MESMNPLLKKASLGLAAAFGFYGLVLVTLTNPYLQRHVLYAHKIQTTWWHDINRPETFGFAKNQVTPFQITTSDNETLYAWHVLPLGLYASHETELRAQSSGLATDITRSKAFELLRDDPEARLVINFHGNAGHIAQGWRPDSYRTYSSMSPSKIHILAIDYRGYGYSSGFPTESGLILDAIATVNWALNTAKIPPERIVVLGQSLGTAVSAAVASHFADAGITFTGVVLIAPFTDLPNLLTTYSIGGWAPVLSPLGRTPALQRMFKSQIVDQWPTLERLKSFISQGSGARLFLLHAKDDFDIPYAHSETLFRQLANSTMLEKGYGDSVLEAEELERMVEKRTTKLGDGGEKDGYVRTWVTGGTGSGSKGLIQEEVAICGGHNRVMTYSGAAMTVWRAFRLNEKP